MSTIWATSCGDTYNWAHVIPNGWSFGKDENGNNSVQGDVTTTAGSTGNCLRIDSMPVGGFATLLRKNLPSSYSRLIYGLRFKADELPFSGYDHIAALWDNAAVLLAVLAVDSSGAISAWRGGYPSSGGTLIGTATVPNLIQQGVMIHLGLDITLDNTASGAFTLYADSQVVKTESSVVTAPNANGAAMFSIHSGHILAASHYFDDIYINDTTGSFNNGFDGDIAGISELPNAPGQYTEWSIGGSAPAATNWGSVNQTDPDDGVTFVEAGTIGLRDTYKVPALPANVVGIVMVSVDIDTQTDASGLAGGASISPLIGDGATIDTGTPQFENTSWGVKSQYYGENPLTAAAWDVADWADIEVGAVRAS